MTIRIAITVFASAILAMEVFSCAQTTQPFSVPTVTKQIIDKHCLGCHDAETQEGDLRLDNLGNLSLKNRLDLLNRMQEQIFFKSMPPRDQKQPSATDRDKLANWLSTELNKHHASKLDDKLRKPEFGNYVDHDKLFSGECRHLKGFTYDRRWLISEYIFEAKVNQLLNHQPFQTIDGKREPVIGDNNRRVNLTNPFLLPPNTGVRYYANTTLNGGHLLTMITNAKEVSTYMIYLTRRDKRYLPAIEEIMRLEWEQAKVLAARKDFLDKFIERVCRETYGEKNDELLPDFVRVEIKPVVQVEGKEIKKSPYHAAQPGHNEVVLIFQSMQRHKANGQSDAQLVEKCEREWFNLGHNQRTIQARLTFLAGYMEEFRKQIDQHRYEQRYKLPDYRPPPKDEMEIITNAILKHRKKGDRYHDIARKCLEGWQEEFKHALIKEGLAGNNKIDALVGQLFFKIFQRHPGPEEAQKYATLTRAYFQSLGHLDAIEKLIQTLILRSEFVYRPEFGQGKSDADGRRLMSPRDASFAFAYALTDSSPDVQLVQAAESGRLNSREDYQREVKRLLENREQFYVIDEAVQRIQSTASITNSPIRKLRFFREFFGYPKLLAIFKDNKRFGSDYDKAKGRLVGEADRLVDHILQQDEKVFEELLTTENFYVFHSGDNEAMSDSSKRIRRIYDYFKDLDWQNFEAEDLLKHKPFLEEVKMRGVNVANLVSKGRRNSIREFKTAMTSFAARFDKGQTAAAPFVSFPAHGPYNASTRTGLQLRSPQVASFFNIKLDNWNYPAIQPAKVPNRKGMLTHPAWLIAHAQNQETDPVRRGKWVREKLLAGTVPDLPITVDAVIPEDHHKTLRTRLVGVTEKQECWKCHKRMNPLGYPFEMYDDFGRFRTKESLEHPDNLIKKNPGKGGVYADLRDIYQTLPVNSQGYLEGTGDKTLDGEVDHAIELAERLAKSTRVRQSIIRYAFRYFLGRNEYLSDSKTLIDAEQAYLTSGGSFDAVIVSLLTSDSFIYRKARRN